MGVFGASPPPSPFFMQDATQRAYQRMLMYINRLNHLNRLNHSSRAPPFASTR